jgi:hypothetical protein
MGKEVAFVIGNGESRKPFNLEKLRGKGVIVGCNALYRDFTPDILTAIDSRMIKEITSKNYHKENQFIIPANRASNIPELAKINLIKGFNTTGGFALQYIGHCGFKKAYMLGFDCFDGNIYENTQNYTRKKLKNYDTFVRNYNSGIKQYPYTKYINVIREKDGLTKHLQHLNNYSVINYDEFERILNSLSKRKLLLKVSTKEPELKVERLNAHFPLNPEEYEQRVNTRRQNRLRNRQRAV